MLPPPRLSTATSYIHSTPTLVPGSSWGPLAASAAAARAEAAEPGRIGDLKCFTLWETKTRFYLVAYNTSQTRFRILKVDRTPPIAATAGAGDRSDHRPTETAREETPTGATAACSRNDPLNTTSVSARHPQPTEGRWTSGQKETTSSAHAQGSALPESLAAKHGVAAGISASGQRYLNEDDGAIPQLSKATLDSRLAEAGIRDGQPANLQPSGMIGSKPGSVNQSAPSSTTHNAPHDSKRQQGAGIPCADTAHDAAPRQSTAPSSSTRISAFRRGGHKSRTSDADWELNVTSDSYVYTRTQVAELLDMIREGNRSTGGLKEVGRFFGIVGFVRFTGAYYMVLISRRSVVALIGGHYVYHCDETVTIPVCHPGILAALPGRTKIQDQEEARLLHLFKQVDLSKNFYFSYTYDLTKTLQDNLTTPSVPSCRASSHPGPSASSNQTTTAWGFNEKFVWNHHLLLPAFGSSDHAPCGTDSRSGWVLPLVYGFVDQAKLSVLSRTVYVTLIARRSRHFAGARFLKRGVNEKGQVANDVETEQIVSEALTTPFFSPARRRTNLTADRGVHGSIDPQDGTGRQSKAGADTSPQVSTGANEAAAEKVSLQTDHGVGRYDASPRYTSYVMLRGSIPIYWTQDSTNMSPRPPIEISLVDPYYSAAALHFDDLFYRYGSPVIVLNLIKSKEKQEREVKLLRAFSECIEYLNQFLPVAKRIKHIAWDMSRASKSHDQDVIGILEDIAEESVETTRFFHSGPEPGSAGDDLTASWNDTIAPRELLDDGVETRFSFLHGRKRKTILLQDGVVRVNCVDCLDRTNAAQFVIGKAAFGHQLHALGLLSDPSLPFDSDAVNMLTEMYHDLGDTIAMQYGGSALAHTTDTYRKINQWTSHSRDMLESMRRFYANSFADADKQAAINLFLGVDPEAPDFAPYVFPEETPPPAAGCPDRVPSEPTEPSGRAEDVASDAPAASESPKVHAMVPFRPHYQHWFEPGHLETNKGLKQRTDRLRKAANTDTGFWAEYYRPSLFTDLQRHHAFKMTAVQQHPSVGHPGDAGSGVAVGGQGSAAYGAMGRHMRSSSDLSTKLLPVSDERPIVYPSPFKPRSVSGQQRTAMAADHNSRRRHAKRDSIDSNEAFRGESSVAGNSLPSSPSSSITTTAAPSRALIGGVKRWISINRPISQIGARRGQRRMLSTAQDGIDNDQVTPGPAGTRGGVTSREGGVNGRLANLLDPNSFNFAGPWQAMGIGQPGILPGGAASQSVSTIYSALDAVLARVTNPSVSREEEAEYQFYATQFRNESLAEDGGSLDPSTRADLADRRARATGVNDRFIDEADVRIYEDSVALKRGERSAIEELLQLASWPGRSGVGVTVDPALLAYASSYENFPATASLNSEVKVRAYSSWLQMGY